MRFYLFLTNLLINWSVCDGLHHFFTSYTFINSHVVFYNRFTAALIRNNHSVTHYTARWAQMPNVTKIPEGMNLVETEYVHRFLNYTKFQAMMYGTLSNRDTMDVLQRFGGGLSDNCASMINQIHKLRPELTKLGSPADIVWGNSWDVCPMIVQHMFNVTDLIMMQVGSYISDYACIWHGLPQLPSYIPSVLTRAGDRMGFWHRFGNAFMAFMTPLNSYFPNSPLVKERQFWMAPPNEDRPDPLHDLPFKAAAIVVNGEQLLDFPRPLFHTVWFLGDAPNRAQNDAKQKQKKTQTLSVEWEKILKDGEHRNGTILVSFGTAVDSKHMPDDMKLGMLDSLISLVDFTVVWRFDGDLPTRAFTQPHLHISKWIPQKQLLEHPRTKLFITHGGYNSLLESSQSGVPVVMVPFWLDQYTNTQRAIRHGIGLSVDKMMLHDADTLVHAVNDVLHDSSYASDAARLKHLFGDRVVPSNVLNEHHIKMVIKPHFKRIYDLTRAKQLSFIQYHCLDVWFIWCFCAVIIVYFVVKMVRFASRKINAD